jgi:fructose-1,6-bisphosphatase/inositol monophosphatase family enzyme
VTQADREAEQAVRAVLRDAFPDHGFLGEELGQEGPKDRRFIIDPIDGTKNFIRGIPFWAVLIGLEERGEITTGVVFNPVTGDLIARAEEEPSPTASAIASDCAHEDATLCTGLNRCARTAAGTACAARGRHGPVARLVTRYAISPRLAELPSRPI